MITDCSPPRKRDLKKFEEEEDDDERLWFLMSAGIGFVITFLVTFSSLTIKEVMGIQLLPFLRGFGERIIRCCIFFKASLFSIFRVARKYLLKPGTVSA